MPQAATLALVKDAFVFVHSEDHFASIEPFIYKLDDFKSNSTLKLVENNRWRSRGDDPQWTMADRVRAGFISIRIKASCEGMRAPAAREAVAEVFFYKHQVDSQAEVFTFPLKGKSISIDALIYLESDISSIRFDPVNTECEIVVESFGIKTIDLRAVSDSYMISTAGRILCR